MYKIYIYDDIYASHWVYKVHNNVAKMLFFKTLPPMVRRRPKHTTHLPKQSIKKKKKTCKATSHPKTSVS